METSSSEARLDLFTDTAYSPGAEPVLAGNITVSGTAGQSDGQGGREFNTLDEPISHTIKRDLAAVGAKFAAVLWPKEKKSLLREWDLWGPLILCTIMATILQGHGEEDGQQGDGGPQFAEVFVIVWVGAMIVTLNTKLLGKQVPRRLDGFTNNDRLTTIHSRWVHILLPVGVCPRLLPPAPGSVLGPVSGGASGKPEHRPGHCQVRHLDLESDPVLIITTCCRCVIVLAGFAWSTFASMQFLGDCNPPPRKALAVYPMFLFYLVVGWMVISHTAD